MARVFWWSKKNSLSWVCEFANFENFLVTRGDPNHMGQEITTILYLVEIRTPLLL